jgi:hypothetical protein
LAIRLGVAPVEDTRRALELADETNRMLHALVKALEGPPNSRPPARPALASRLSPCP